MAFDPPKSACNYLERVAACNPAGVCKEAGLLRVGRCKGSYYDCSVAGAMRVKLDCPPGEGRQRQEIGAAAALRARAACERGSQPASQPASQRAGRASCKGAPRRRGATGSSSAPCAAALATRRRCSPPAPPPAAAAHRPPHPPQTPTLAKGPRRASPLTACPPAAQRPATRGRGGTRWRGSPRCTIPAPRGARSRGARSVHRGCCLAPP